MSKSYVNRYEAMGLSPEQIEGLHRIASAYTLAGQPMSVEDLASFAFSPPTMEDLEKLAGILQNEFRSGGIQLPWHWQLRWWLLDALDALRRLLRQLWSGSAALACPESYLGSGWEEGACDKCKAKGLCQSLM